MKIQNDLLTKNKVAEATAEALVNTEATAEEATAEKLKSIENLLVLADKAISLTQEQKQFLFDKDFQEAFDSIQGFKKDNEATVLTKDGKSYKYKYVDLSAVTTVVKEAIKDKFYYVHFTDDLYLKTVVRHYLTGLEISISTKIPETNNLIDMLSRGNFAQRFGSWQTYTKRYHLLALFGLAEEDDDAQSLTDNKQQPTVKQPDNIGKPINIDNLKKEAERKQLGKNIADMINNKELVTIDEVKDFIESDDNYKDDLQYFLGEKVLAKFIEYLNKANK